MAGERNGIDYAVSLSPSGLLIDIEVRQHGDVCGSVQIDRSAWPSIVDAVRQVELQGMVEAQIENIISDSGESSRLSE